MFLFQSGEPLGLCEDSVPYYLHVHAGLEFNWSGLNMYIQVTSYYTAQTCTSCEINLFGSDVNQFNRHLNLEILVPVASSLSGCARDFILVLSNIFASSGLFPSFT